jgi:DNA polymerase-3 subunit gamma/tau
VVETVDVLRLNGLSAASTLEDMGAVLQRMAVLQAVPDMAGGDASDPDAFETSRLAARMPADETQLLYSLCLHGRGELGLAPDEYAALTMVLLRLLAFKPDSGTAEKKTLTRPETPAAAAPQAPPTAPVAASTAAPAPAASLEQAAPKPEKFEEKQAIATAGKAQVATDSIANKPAADDGIPIVSEAVPVQPPADRVTQALPVRTPEGVAAAASAQLRTTAPEPPPAVLTIPVRQTPEPGARLQPQAAGAGRPASRFTPTEEGEVWHSAVQQLIASEAITALVRELALQSQLVARDGEHWLLRVERESLNQPATRERLRAALAAAGFAQQISVELGVVIDSPARRNAVIENARQQRAQDIVMNDPFVQTMVREFDARVVPGSIKPF